MHFGYKLILLFGYKLFGYKLILLLNYLYILFIRILYNYLYASSLTIIYLKICIKIKIQSSVLTETIKYLKKKDRSKTKYFVSD